MSRTAGRRRWRAGLRLRSGAFAPDYPVVIFVTAFGCSFRFPRAHLRAPPATGRRPAVLAIALAPALLGRVVCLAFLWRECLSPKLLRGPPKGGRVN